MFGGSVQAVTVQRRTDAQKKLKRVAKIVSVIAIETVGPIVDRELRSKPDIDTVAMG